MQNVTINIPEIYDKNIQRLKDAGVVPSRSEAIRNALNDFLVEEYNINSKLLNYQEGNEWKICTANIPKKDIEFIETLIENNKLYSSRSEIVRIALRKSLLRNLPLLEKKEMIDKTILLKEIDTTITEKEKNKKITLKKDGEGNLHTDEIAFGFYHGEVRILEELKQKIEEGEFDQNNNNDQGDE